MSTALKVVSDDEKSDAELELETIEDEINSEIREAFYHIGQRLLQIREGKKYTAAGFKSWAEYCKSGRIEHGKATADRYIQASELRPHIKTPRNSRHDWTHSQMLELCKCATIKDANRVASKALATAKRKKCRVTAELLKDIRDGATETGAAAKRQEKALESASLTQHLEELSDLLVDWRTSLEQIEVEQWGSVDPVTLTRVKAESKALYDYLRS